MAGAGQAAQILPFLKDYFPDDAEDNDALDWWFDKACDMCGESGDRARAEALLPIRYQLQEDEKKIRCKSGSHRKWSLSFSCATALVIEPWTSPATGEACL